MNACVPLRISGFGGYWIQNPAKWSMVHQSWSCPNLGPRKNQSASPCITTPVRLLCAPDCLIDFLSSSNIPRAVCHCMSCHGHGQMRFLVSTVNVDPIPSTKFKRNESQRYVSFLRLQYPVAARSPDGANLAEGTGFREMGEALMLAATAGNQRIWSKLWLQVWLNNLGPIPVDLPSWSCHKSSDPAPSIYPPSPLSFKQAFMVELQVNTSGDLSGFDMIRCPAIKTMPFQWDSCDVLWPTLVFKETVADASSSGENPGRGATSHHHGHRQQSLHCSGWRSPP